MKEAEPSIPCCRAIGAHLGKTRRNASGETRAAGLVIPCCTKITLPQVLAFELLQSCGNFGVSAASVFPGYDALFGWLLGDFPIHVAAQIGGNTAQLHVQPVAGAAAGQTEDKFNPRLFQRVMLSNDAAAMPL